MGGNLNLYLVSSLRAEEFAQGELAPLRVEQPALGLGAEELPLEPLDLPGQLVVGLLQFLMGFQEHHDLLSTHRGGLRFQCHTVLLQHATARAKHYSIEKQTKCLLAQLEDIRATW